MQTNRIPQKVKRKRENNNAQVRLKRTLVVAKFLSNQIVKIKLKKNLKVFGAKKNFFD